MWRFCARSTLFNESDSFEKQCHLEVIGMAATKDLSEYQPYERILAEAGVFSKELRVIIQVNFHHLSSTNS